MKQQPTLQKKPTNTTERYDSIANEMGQVTQDTQKLLDTMTLDDGVKRNSPQDLSPVKSEPKGQLFFRSAPMIEKPLDLKDIASVETHLPKLLAGENSIAIHEPTIKSCLRMMRQQLKRLNSALHQDNESSRMTADFECASRWLSVLGMIHQKALEQKNIGYFGAMGSILQKVTHLYIKILLRHDYHTEIAKKARELFLATKIQLEHPEILANIQVVSGHIKYFELYSPTKYGEKNRNQELQTAYQKELCTAKEKLEAAFLLKNLQKIVTDSRIEKAIEADLRRNRKNPNEDVLSPFHRLTARKCVDLKYLEQNFDREDVQEHMLICTTRKEKLYDFILLVRHLAFCREKLQNQPVQTAATLKDWLLEGRRLLRQAFPKEQDKENICQHWDDKLNVLLTGDENSKKLQEKLALN